MDINLNSQLQLDADLAWQVLDLAPVMVRDFDGRIRLWTAAMQRLYGFAAVDALDHVSHELLATQFPKPLAQIEREFQNAGRWRGELVQRRRDGASVRVDSEWVLIRGGDGAERGIMVFNHDITAQREAESRLLELGGIVETSDDAIIGKTLDGLVTSWNRGAEVVFGYTADEMIGRPIARLFPPELIAEEEAILARLRAGERIQHYETTRLRKDGSSVRVALSVSPIHDRQGRIAGAAKIARDITEQEAVRLRLDTLQAELLHIGRLHEMGQMASALAHELNQPLSAASNYLHAARKLIERGEPQRAVEGCDRAVEQIARAGEVIRRLRTFLKKGEAQRALEDLGAVLEDGCALALVGSRSAGVKVGLHHVDRDIVAAMDKVQIQQVILNLVRNALEATAGRPDAALAVTIERRGEVARVSVADNGPGIAKSLRENLFKPFNTTKANGMGVGLSLCREIMDAHGGDIGADDPPGGGALFWFTLPLDAGDTGPAD